jgi:hypothetical protein
MNRLLFLLLLGTAWAQFPDAPTPQPDGTVCLDSAGNAVAWSTSCGWRQVKEIPPAPVTFWTFAPNRPWTATLKSPWYWGAQGLADGMTIWDWKRHNCKGNYPCSNQFWSERGAAMIAVGLLQWPLDAKVSRPVGLVPVGILFGKSTYSLITGHYQ